MTNAVSEARTSLFASFARRLNLRFPTLFLLLAIITIADILIPDFIPFVDEIGFALLTVLVGSWKRRTGAPQLASDSQDSPSVRID